MSDILHGESYILMLGENLIDITARILIELFIVAKDNNRDFNVAKHR
jgi:hypothetical protein